MDIYSRLNDCFFSPLGRHLWERCCLIFIPFRGYILSVSKPLRFSHLTLFPLSVLYHMLQWYWYFWAWIQIYSWYSETIFNFKTFLFHISLKFFSNIAGFLSFFSMKLRSNISGVFKWSSMCLKGFPFVSVVKKNLPAMQETLETWVRSLGQEESLEEEMAIHSSILSWEIPWTKEPGGLQCLSLQRIKCDWARTVCLNWTFLCPLLFFKLVCLSVTCSSLFKKYIFWLHHVALDILVP